MTVSLQGRLAHEPQLASGPVELAEGAVAADVAHLGRVGGGRQGEGAQKECAESSGSSVWQHGPSSV